MSEEKIIHYIKKHLRKGFDIGLIRAHLLKNGYSPRHVDPLIHKIKHEQIYDLAKYMNKEMKFGLRRSEIKNYLIAIGHPAHQVNEAIERIIAAKRHVTGKRKVKERKKKFLKLKYGCEGYWHKLKPWQKGGLVASTPLVLISFLSVVVMILRTVAQSGRLNCYSLGRVISCSFIESTIFYILLFLAFFVLFCIPAFFIGAIVTHFILRRR